jgi:anaerobic ribonucleoside-triphosphate reductase activating protein
MGQRDGHINVGRIVWSSTGVGPGRRVAIFTRGCDRRCHGCYNTQFQPHEPLTLVPVAGINTCLKAFAASGLIDGITLSGGEPLLQARALAEVGRQAQALGLSIILFSGFALAEILDADDATDDWLALIENIDLIVAGQFQQELQATSGLAGSINQEYYYRTGRLLPFRNEIEHAPKHWSLYIGDNGSIGWTGYPSTCSSGPVLKRMPPVNLRVKLGYNHVC